MGQLGTVEGEISYGSSDMNSARSIHNINSKGDEGGAHTTAG